jgi:5-methylcytosine-specific restriction enzyme subunit McrC
MLLDEFEVIESKPAVLVLAEGEVDALQLIGRELASASTWWGSTGSDPTRSVVSTERMRDGSYRVIFRDVIGLVRVGDKQIRVKPKIPMAHFSFIASRSDLAPRVSNSVTQVAEGADFSAVIARWCVEAAEKLLAQGLRKDYTDRADEVDQVQGRILPMETTMLTSIGVPRAVCSYQEFSEDTMLNRVLKAACLKVACMDRIDPAVRARARQVAFRMDNVGVVQPNDLRVRVDRLTANYSRVLNLSLLVLAGLGLTVAAGRHIGTAFLIRTPELIEDGLRSILKEGLQDIKVTKRRLMLGDSGLSINPDLVFGNTTAVADVKYRLLGKDWSKSDLNQVVTFATGFRTYAAAVLGFSANANALPRSVSVGQVRVKAFAWSISGADTPQTSSGKFVADLREWLQLLSLGEFA